MRVSKLFALALPLALCVIAAPAWGAEDKVSNLMTDDGRLDPAWFGATAPEFHRCEGDRCKVGKDEITFDYFWVKPGFDIKGHTLMMKAWEPGPFLGDAKREDNEIKNGAKITTQAAAGLVKQLNKAWKGAATASATDGDWIVTARLVDCAGPFGFGFVKFSNATYDLKINDKASGALLLALHNRHIGGNDVVSDFIENTGNFLARLPDAEKLYGMGETIAAADARHQAEAAKEQEKKKKK
jgi:hypothetical protein